MCTMQLIHCKVFLRPPHFGADVVVLTLGKLTGFRFAFNGNQGLVTLLRKEEEEEEAMGGSGGPKPAA